MSPMMFRFESPADGNLAETVCLVEATHGPEQVTIRASMVHEEERPQSLAERAEPVGGRVRRDKTPISFFSRFPARIVSRRRP